MNTWKPILHASLLAASAALCSAQTPATPPVAVKVPVYDVVSIKPNKTGSGHTHVGIHDGSFDASNVTLKGLLMDAYNLKPSQIVGLPAWANSAHFDIKAKVVEPDKDAFKKLTDEQLDSMLQPILTDRFQLKSHHEPCVQPVYELVVMKGGPKFKPSAVADGDGKTVNGLTAGSVQVHNTNMEAAGVDMNTVASELSSFAQRLVVDKTGLPGKYDLELKWSGDDAPSTEADAVPGLFTAVQEQLGLKLEAGKAEVSCFVIDRALPPVED